MIWRWARASARAPRTGSTGAVPNGRVSCPRPWTISSSKFGGAAVWSCWWGATAPESASAPIHTPYSCATFSRRVMRPSRSAARSSGLALVSRHGAAVCAGESTGRSLTWDHREQRCQGSLAQETSGEVGDDRTRHERKGREHPGAYIPLTTDARNVPPGYVSHIGRGTGSRRPDKTAVLSPPASADFNVRRYGSRPDERTDVTALPSSSTSPAIANATVISRLRLTVLSWLPRCL